MSIIIPIPIINSSLSTTSPLSSASQGCYPAVQVQQHRRSLRSRKASRPWSTVYDQHSPASSDSSPPQGVKPSTRTYRTAKQVRRKHLVEQNHVQEGVVYDCIIVRAETSPSCLSTPPSSQFSRIGVNSSINCRSKSKRQNSQTAACTPTSNTTITTTISPTFLHHQTPTNGYLTEGNSSIVVGDFGHHRSQRITHAHMQAAVATTLPTPNATRHESSFSSFSSSATSRPRSREYRNRRSSPYSRSNSLSSSARTTKYQSTDSDSSTESDGHPSVTCKGSSTLSRPRTRSSTRFKQLPSTLSTSVAVSPSTNTLLAQSLPSPESTPPSSSSPPSVNNTKLSRRRGQLTVGDIGTTKYPRYLEKFLREKMETEEEGALQRMEAFVEEVIQIRGLESLSWQWCKLGGCYGWKSCATGAVEWLNWLLTYSMLNIYLAAFTSYILPCWLADAT